MSAVEDVVVRLTILEAREEIKELTARYCWHVVRGEAQAVSELYVQEGIFEVQEGSARLRFVGQRAIEERLSKTISPPGKQVPVIANHIIRVDGDVAEGTCVMRNSPKAKDGEIRISVGVYHDRYRRQNGKWLFSERLWFTYCPVYAIP